MAFLYAELLSLLRTEKIIICTKVLNSSELFVTVYNLLITSAHTTSIMRARITSFPNWILENRTLYGITSAYTSLGCICGLWPNYLPFNGDFHEAVKPFLFRLPTVEGEKWFTGWDPFSVIIITDLEFWSKNLSIEVTLFSNTHIRAISPSE